MAGNWASLVAECMPYIDLWRGGPSPCQPPTGQAESAGGGVLSSCTAGIRVRADKHWQNFKNCCRPPTDVHYVSRALGFTA